MPYHLCHDCGTNHPIYMLKWEIWKAVVKDDDFWKIHLCPSCAQCRLGRPLTPEDLNPDVLCNQAILFFAASHSPPKEPHG